MNNYATQHEKEHIWYKLPFSRFPLSKVLFTSWLSLQSTPKKHPDIKFCDGSPDILNGSPSLSEHVHTLDQ